MTTDASTSAPSGADGYEFQASEEGIIRSLAGTMRGAAMASVVLGLGHLVLGGLRLWGGHMLGGVEGLGTAVVALLGAMWVMSAAKSFQLVVDTKGNDIKNMLNAVAHLRNMFGLALIACVALILLMAGGTYAGHAAHERARERAAEATAAPSP
jgi:hypothetical protein